MSHILLVEENEKLTQMYKSILENLGFRVVNFPNYKELYKHLNGEGFTAILLDGQITRSTLDFISKVRKGNKVQIPILVVLNDNVDRDIFTMFGNVTCIPRFPDSGKLVGELTKKLSLHSQFKGLIN